MDGISSVWEFVYGQSVSLRGRIEKIKEKVIPDSPDEKVDVEKPLPVEKSITRVHMAVGGQELSIESELSLDEISEKAKEIWSSISPEPHSAVGFQAPGRAESERAVLDYVIDPYEAF